MSSVLEPAEETEPPAAPAADPIVLGLRHGAHAAVIGHRTLPFMLALLQAGCDAVRSLRPGAPAPDCEPVDLAWIVDPRDQAELSAALHAARRRVESGGRILLEVPACRVAVLPLRTLAEHEGLVLLATDPVGGRRVLATAPTLALAA